MSTEQILTVDDVEFWERLYLASNIPWDLGRPAPPIETFMDSPYAVPPGTIACLGCGTGHDCLTFTRRKFSVTGVDFAPGAIRSTHQKFLQEGVSGSAGFLLERDFFQMDDYNHYYDYVLEHSFFNSIHPFKRRTYAHRVYDLLKPGGRLIALWWLMESKSGPPWGIAKDQLFPLFREFFTFDIVYEPSNSVPERRGHELMTLMTRKD